MKRILIPVAAMVAVGAVACADQPTMVAPDNGQYELVPGSGTTVANATVDVFGSFVVGGSGASTPINQWIGNGINEEGKILGTCVGTRWSNPSGRQAGALVHPHCVRGYELWSSQQVESITLASISADEFTNRAGIQKLQLDEGDNLHIQYNVNQEQTQGKGILVAYGRKGSDSQYGKFVIDLTVIATAKDSEENLLDGRCYVGEAEAFEAYDPDAAENPGWLNCVAETTPDGELVRDSETGIFKGMVTARFYANVDAVHDPEDEDFDADEGEVVRGYLYWVKR